LRMKCCCGQRTKANLFQQDQQRSLFSNNVENRLADFRYNSNIVAWL